MQLGERVRNSLFRPVSMVDALFNIVPSMERFEWIGQRPKKSLWKRMWNLYEPEIERGATISLFNYDELYRFRRRGMLSDNQVKMEYDNLYVNSAGAKQLVKENDQYDGMLLDASSLNSFPREVCQVVIESKNGERVASDFIIGTKSRTSSTYKIGKLIHQMYSKFRQNGGEAKMIQINHTHPSLEMIAIEGRRLKTIFHGLSSSDIQVGKTVSEFIDVPVFVRAITPSGINYSVRF